MSSISSSSHTTSSDTARSGHADVKLEQPDLVLAAAAATTRLLRKAGVSCYDFLLAFQNKRFRERMVWSLRESVAYDKHLRAAASASAVRVGILARITSGNATSPDAFLHRHQSTTGKQRLSFVGHIKLEGNLSKAFVIEFSTTRNTVITIKRGSCLYRAEDFRKVQNRSLVYLLGLLRGTRNGEPCLVFDRDSRTKILTSARFSDVRRLHVSLDAQVYNLHAGPPVAMPPPPTNNNRRSDGAIYIDCTESDYIEEAFQRPPAATSA